MKKIYYYEEDESVDYNLDNNYNDEDNRGDALDQDNNGDDNSYNDHSTNKNK